MLPRALALAAILFAAACAQPQNDRRRDEAPVLLAAASLQGALDEIADQWSQSGHPRPVISYAGSQVHARQAGSGAPADIVFLADREWMDVLARDGHLDPASRRDVVANAMVVVRPIGGAATGSSPAATLAGERIAMGEPETVPAGRYAKAALVSLGLWDEVAPRVIPAENVRAALALAERGEVDAAIVYASDAAASDRVRLAVRLPRASHPPIRYPAALLRSATSGEAAGFLDYLSSPASARVFARHGFIPLSAGE